MRRSPRTRLVTATVAALATLALVACGGDDDDDTSATIETEVTADTTDATDPTDTSETTDTSDPSDTAVDDTTESTGAGEVGPREDYVAAAKEGFPVDDDALGECIAEALISDDVFTQIEDLGVSAEQLQEEGPQGVGIVLGQDQATAMAEEVAACGVVPADVLEDEAELGCAEELMSNEVFAQYITFTLFRVAPTPDLQAEYEAMEDCMGGTATTTS
jgi:hypothetical protein